MTSLLNKLIAFFSGFSRKPVLLAIARKYTDANGSYVGELYMHGTFAGVDAYRMIGVSLDNLPLDCDVALPQLNCVLDTQNDFLAALPEKHIRVGALDPAANDSVRTLIARLPQKRMSVLIQNRFIEHVLQ